MSDQGGFYPRELIAWIMNYGFNVGLCPGILCGDCDDIYTECSLVYSTILGGSLMKGWREATGREGILPTDLTLSTNYSDILNHTAVYCTVLFYCMLNLFL